ncbi:MAG: lactate racemase domain-containing protein [Bacteroidota bacterium]
MSTVDQLLEKIVIPKMVKVKQKFERPVITDIAKELSSGLAEKKVLEGIKKGQKIAVAVGSRGIANQPLMVKVLISELRRVGAEPFIVPAMGSHAGATAEGQREMLIGMGISEDYVGAPIRSSMDVVQLGTSGNGLPVYMDRNAYEADGIVIINRIKPHVCFRFKYESGLMKMIVIGLGKQKGADICHQLGFEKMPENLESIGLKALEKANLIFGIGVVENAYHETSMIQVLAGAEIPTKEPKLLEEAKRLAPKLYFDSLETLIIDEIGKDISGSGFDTNVVGRYHSPCVSGGPKIHRLAILDITDRSHGNGNGLGMADFTTKRAANKFRPEQTYPNTLTATLTGGVKIPATLENDLQVIQACLKTCNLMDYRDARVVRIKNTLSLDEIEVSENMLASLKDNPNLEVVGTPYAWQFDRDGNLF